MATSVSPPAVTASAPRSVLDNGRVRVARVLMNLDALPEEIRASRGAHVFLRGRVEAMYDEDPDAYNRRLEGLAERAALAGAGVLLLPALALVRDGALPRRLEAALARVPYVVAGVLGRRPVGDHAEVREFGTVIDSYDAHAVRLLGVGGINLFTAISMTLGRIGDGGEARSAAHPPIKGAPALILDTGHHWYTGHYVEHTIGGAVRRAPAIVGGVRAAGIVSYWKSRNADPSEWFRPKGEDWITSDRIRVPAPGGGPADILDIIDVDFGA